MGFSRQEYWSGLLFPHPGDLPDPAIEPASSASPALASGFFTTEPPGLPWWLSSKEFACNAGDTEDLGSILEAGRSPGERNGYPLQNSCLENSVDRGTWRATVHEVANSRTQLSN